MNLIIFDIDGTLTQTNDVDSKCFAQAIKDALKITDLNTNWPSYKYSTDSGLVKQIYEEFLQREPTDIEINSIREEFVHYLKYEWQNNKKCYVPVLGAAAILHQINQLSNWHLAIATGGWKQSALFKLDSAHIAHENIPKAYADDHIERAEIINIAIQRAQTQNRVNQYQQIIYVGDRLWDKRAAIGLNIGFVGVGAEFLDDDQVFCISDFKGQPTLIDYLAAF